MKDLNEIRKIIDDIDNKMRDLYEKRMDVVKEVAFYKKENNIAVLDVKREEALIEKNCYLLNNPEYQEYYIEFLKSLMVCSREFQSKLLDQKIIAYQGVFGAFSYIAAKQLFPYSKLNSYATFENVFEIVNKGEVDFGVLPFENSYSGDVVDVLDLFAKYELSIVSVFDLKVKQHLLVNKGAKFTDITDIYSHQQAISQCKIFLEGRTCTIHEFPNTAMAAKFISESKDITKGAIASEEAAVIYNLDILYRDINTASTNTTRFIVISKKSLTEGNHFSMTFTVNNEVGSLSKVIDLIAQYGFNMEKITSRPVKERPFEYYFYVEIVGSINSENAQKLLNDIKKYSKNIKIIGIYNR